MPDRDNWSASMLLCWVLSRDSERVLSMLKNYGGWRIEGDHAGRIRPQTWRDVTLAFSIDGSLPKEEKTAAAIVRTELFIIPAEEEIRSAWRRGEIDGWARRNGSGDIVKIEPIQWAGLRFRALEGHDIAVPVDSEQEPLPLPRPLADYLYGSVPATSTPTVWPDPLFPAKQVMRQWPPCAAPKDLVTQTRHDETPIPAPGAGSVAHLDHTQPTANDLRPAPEPAAQQPKDTNSADDAATPLAEWIFDHHTSQLTFDRLFAEAGRDISLGGFKKRDFLTAYRRVYETSPHHPPATGWPLRTPYKERMAQGKSLNKS
jgi:hypothetical protein